MSSQSPEYSWVRTWLDRMFELPWGERSDDTLDLDAAAEQLDTDHYGLDDVAAFPPTIVHVNECDPLRDEGVWFYRLLLDAGVVARSTQANGTMHAVEVVPMICPDVSRAHAATLARFAATGV